MFQVTEQLSAYAVHVAKHKSAEQIHGTYKKKKKDQSQSVSTVSQNHTTSGFVELNNKKKNAKLHHLKVKKINTTSKIQVMKSKARKKGKNLEKCKTMLKNVCGKERLNYNFMTPANNSQLENDGYENPMKVAMKAFKWMIYPLKLNDFFT